ncbi:hypothetical protein GCM10010289_18400 [Streptomyces violascens]|nr:hypothetical protein GCM10010289_18400 [Streptomyces violascens]
MHPVAVGGGLHRFGERGVSYNGVQQTVQAHEGHPSRGVGNANRPTRVTGRGLPAYDAPPTPAARRTPSPLGPRPTPPFTLRTVEGWSRGSPRPWQDPVQGIPGLRPEPPPFHPADRGRLVARFPAPLSRIRLNGVRGGAPVHPAPPREKVGPACQPAAPPGAYTP